MIFGRNKIIKNAVIQTAKPNLNFPYRHYPANGQWVGTHSLSALSSPCIHIVTYIIYYIDAEDNQNTISFLETDRHGGEIPITKYIRDNGEKIYLHKIEYNTVCIITIILITLIAITAILNIKYRWSK